MFLFSSKYWAFSLLLIDKNFYPFPIWWVNFSDSSWFPHGKCFGIVFCLSDIGASWTCTQINLRNPFVHIFVILCLFSSLSFLPYCLFVAPKCALLLSLLCMLCFLMRMPQFFPCKFFVLLWIMTFQCVSPGGLVFQIGACGICSVNYGVFLGREQYQWKVQLECATIPLGARSSVEHQVWLFRNWRLVVQVVVVYGCCHPAYL